MPEAKQVPNGETQVQSQATRLQQHPLWKQE